jgi:hypothetical protein
VEEMRGINADSVFGELVVVMPFLPLPPSPLSLAIDKFRSEPPLEVKSMMRWMDSGGSKRSKNTHGSLMQHARFSAFLLRVSHQTECVFSHAGRIVNHLRASLSPAKAARLIFMHANKQYL